MILEAIISATVFLSGAGCAAIDNKTNEMIWAGPDTPLVSTTYTDEGMFLLPDVRYPTEATTLLAIIHAENSLQEGEPGHKIPIRCFKNINGIPYEQGIESTQHNHT